MSVLLLTMGPQLGIVADIPALRVGEPGTITFKAVGSFGQVRWSIVGGDLPVEWGAIVPAGDEATVSTAEAIQWGDFEVTVRAVDDQRAPVVRTFSLRVATAVMEIDAIAPQEWIVGTPVSLSRAISGGTGSVYLSLLLRQVRRHVGRILPRSEGPCGFTAHGGVDLALPRRCQRVDVGGLIAGRVDTGLRRISLLLVLQQVSLGIAVDLTP